MPPDAQPGRPLAGDSPPPRRTLDEKLAAARSGQTQQRRRIFSVAGVAVGAVVVVAAAAYLAAEFAGSRTSPRETVASPADGGPVAEERDAVAGESRPASETAAESAPAVTETVETDAPVVETVAEVAPAVEEAPPVVETVTEAPAVEEAPPVAETVTEEPAVEPVAEPVATVPAVPPELAEWLARAEVARVENRPAKEIAALQKILELDPARADARARLQELRAALARAEFAAAVERTQGALDAGDLTSAAQLMAAAAAISPGHEALQPLQNQLQAARAEREFAALMTLGENAGRQDDWQTALALFTRARAIKSNDAGAVAGLSRAQEVVNAARRIAGYLKQPQRLADRRVVDDAAAYLRAVEPVAAHSPKLRARFDKLSAVVADYLTEVEVVVVSDNASDIQVRGVGQVGKTARRAIKLRPGARVFECKRRGYKSKRVPLDIAPGAPGPFEVTVICDEKI